MYNRQTCKLTITIIVKKVHISHKYYRLHSNKKNSQQQRVLDLHNQLVSYVSKSMIYKL